LLRLALSFGLPPRELAQRLTARELVEFEELYRLDPWGPERGDLAAGIVASTIANVNRGPKSEPFRPADFMAYVDREALAARDQERMNAKILETLAPDALRTGKRRKPK
jgi:hypothetical protein